MGPLFFVILKEPFAFDFEGVFFAFVILREQSDRRI